jgi:branched-chain amino acid transport system substrate-binding protein
VAGFLKKYYPEGDIADQLNFTGWNVAVLMSKVIEACGDDIFWRLYGLR